MKPAHASMTSHLPKKNLGQNFLIDQSVINAILHGIRAKTGDVMIEIGPGLGALTTGLVKQVEPLHVVEIDDSLIPKLQEKFLQQLIIHHCDVLQFDFSRLYHPNQKLRLVGNLPYNIATPLLFKLFSINEYIHDMHFMLQQEVGLRLTAKVGDRHYGRLSVMAQYFCDTMPLLTVSPDAFSPAPKVQSSVVRLVPRACKLPVNDLEVFSQTVQTAFNQRRKTLRNSLAKLVNPQQLLNLQIDPKKRAQELSVEEFVKLSNMISDGKV